MLILFSRVFVWIPIDRRHQASTPSNGQARRRSWHVLAAGGLPVPPYRRLL